MRCPLPWALDISTSSGWASRDGYDGNAAVVGTATGR